MVFLLVVLFVVVVVVVVVVVRGSGGVLGGVLTFVSIESASISESSRMTLPSRVRTTSPLYRVNSPGTVLTTTRVARKPRRERAGSISKTSGRAAPRDAARASGADAVCSRRSRSRGGEGRVVASAGVFRPMDRLSLVLAPRPYTSPGAGLGADAETLGPGR